MRWLCLFLLSVSVAVAQQKASLQGHVVDASARPIERVKLALLSENPSPILCCINDVNGPHTQTDPNGGFRFDSVQPGRYRLVAEKSGYALQAYGGKDDWREGTFLDLRTDAIMDVVFPLVAAGTISGVLLDENGDPVWGKPVVASHLSHDVWGAVVSGSVAEGGSDIHGRFTISNLPPGTYYLSGSPERIKVDPGSALAGYVARTLIRPVLASVSGQITGLRLAVADTSPGRRVKCWLGISAWQGCLVDARISMGRRGKCQSMAPIGHTGSIAEDASFQFKDVQPGAYTMCLGAGQNMEYGRMDLDVGPEGVDNIVFRLEPHFPVVGYMTIDGQPAHDLTVTLRSPRFAGGTRSNQINKDGSFALADVAAGRYDLSIAPLPVGTYVASVRLRDREVAGPVDFTGGDPGPLVIALKRSSSEIRGTAPIGSIITLIPEPERPNQIDLSLRTTTDTTGLFILKSVAPGIYRITAWDELERNAHLDSEFMARYRDKGTLITVDENANRTVTLPAH